MSNNNPVALVTGGARRVGRAITEALHAKGFRVVVHCHVTSIDCNAADELQKKLNGIRKDSAIMISADFSQNVASTANELVQKSVAKWKRLDLVVNSASNFISSSMKEVTSEEFDDAINVNVKCPVFIMKAAETHLRKTRGSVVNMVDWMGLNPKVSHLAHSISKAGLINVTKNAALYLAPEVRVNGIAPGVVLWPDIDPTLHSEQEKIKWLTNTPLGRLGTPGDVAEAIIFLASPAANFITGHILKLDGGWSL